MNPAALVWDFVQSVTTEKAPDHVGRAYQRLIEHFGFNDFLIGRITPDRKKGDRGEAWSMSGTDGWWQFWIRNHYRTDPSIVPFRQSRTPMRWAEMRREIDYKNNSVFEDARAFGVQDGFAISFKLNDGIFAGVTLAAPQEVTNPDHLALVLLASAFCETRLAQICYGPQERPQLSSRERECLCWVAAGKTDWEISCILGISQKTVHEHVRNTLRKLNASTRAHAVAIALSAGQISL